MEPFRQFLNPSFCTFFSPKSPFSSINLNYFLSKIRTNSLFLIISRRLAIMLAFTVLWTLKNEEMVNCRFQRITTREKNAFEKILKNTFLNFVCQYQLHRCWYTLSKVGSVCITLAIFAKLKEMLPWCVATTIFPCFNDQDIKTLIKNGIKSNFYKIMFTKLPGLMKLKNDKLCQNKLLTTYSTSNILWFRILNNVNNAQRI